MPDEVHCLVTLTPTSKQKQVTSQMKQEQDKTIPPLEQVQVSPQRGSTCKTLPLKEMLGHSSIFVSFACLAGLYEGRGN